MCKRSCGCSGLVFVASCQGGSPRWTVCVCGWSHVHGVAFLTVCMCAVLYGGCTILKFRKSGFSGT